MSHPRRLATLLTLLTLAATAALAPTTASAMDGAGSLGTCIPMTDDSGQGTWNGYEFCAVDPVSGGGGAPGAGPSLATPPGPPAVGKEYVVIEEYLNPCQRNSSLCLPRGLRGEGRTLGIKDGDGPGSGGPKGHGGGEAPKGKKKGPTKADSGLTKEECQKLRKEGGLIWPFGEMIADLEEDIVKQDLRRFELDNELKALRRSLVQLADERQRDSILTEMTAVQVIAGKMVLDAMMIEKRTRLWTAMDEHSSARRKSTALEARKTRMLAVGKQATNTELGKCRARYGI